MRDKKSLNIKFPTIEFDQSWKSYGLLMSKCEGKLIKFYEPNLKDEPERVMIMISGDYGFMNPNIIFCSYPLSKKIRDKLKKGANYEETLDFLKKRLIMGKVDDPEKEYLLCDTEQGEFFSVEELMKLDKFAI